MAIDPSEDAQSWAAIIARHDAPMPALAAVVEAGLTATSQQVGAFDDARSLVCAAQHPRNGLVGAALGRTLGMCGELKQLWVDVPYRGTGLGRALVVAFEDEVRARDCRTVYLSTYSFQARPFYEALGYKVALEIPGHGAAGSKFLMLKALTRQP